MHPFKFVRASNDSEAIASAGQDPIHGSFVAGGTTLIDLMKLDVMQPDRLIDINKLAFAGIERSSSGGVIVGALARNSDTAEHALIKEQYPVLSQALLSGASAQLRNMATTGGNLLQKTRCPYFRDVTMPCNKREPGSGCPAIEGYSRMHAIFGVSEHCIAAHPSDMCVALTALDAVIHTHSEQGERKIAINDFFVLPGDHPEHENVLQPGELIVAVELPASKFAAHSHYLKVRDRTSFSFALVSVAACLDIAGGTVRDARIALGGVGTVPWRVKASERILIGSAISDELIAAAAAEAIKDGKPRKYNKFKLELTKRSITRALAQAAGVA